MSFIVSLIKFHFYALLVALAILYAPFANDVKFTEFKIPSVPVYPAGSLTLNNAEKLFEGEIRGPECFAKYKGELYISAHGGLIYKLTSDNKLVKVLKTGEECENHWWEEVKCGRPLGITFDKSGNLYFADCYNGIFVADLSKGKFDGNLKKIVSLDKPIAGKKPVLPNSLVISKDGFMYWTDSSTRHRLHDGILSLLADGDGRLIKHNLKTGENTVLMDNLKFANGLTLSKNEDFIVVAETGHSRVHKFHLKGPKAGKSEIFLDNLPGFPDNIRRYGPNDDLITVTVLNPFTPGTFMPNHLEPFPTVKKLVYKTFKLIDNVFNYLNGIYPNFVFTFIQHWTGHFESFEFLVSKLVKVMIVDEAGKVVAIHESNDGTAYKVCDFIEHNGYRYLASPFNNFLGRKSIA